MKKNTMELIEEEIKERKKVPEEVKLKIRKEIINNLLLALFVVSYFIFINLGYRNIKQTVFITDMNVFSISALLITILLFEQSYKKESGKLLAIGIEVFFIALITLVIPYAFYYLSDKYKIMAQVMGAVFTVYYLLKCLVISKKMKKNYFKEANDIKDIVKKDAKKKNTEKDEEEVIEEKIDNEEILENTAEESKIEEKQPKKKTTSSSTAKAKTGEKKKTTKNTTTKKATTKTTKKASTTTTKKQTTDSKTKKTTTAKKTAKGTSKTTKTATTGKITRKTKKSIEGEENAK